MLNMNILSLAPPPQKKKIKKWHYQLPPPPVFQIFGLQTILF